MTFHPINSLREHRKICELYKKRMQNKQRSNFLKGHDWWKDDPEKLEAAKKKNSESMKALITAEPWRRDKMRETAKRTLNVWARSDEGRKKSSETAIETSARPEIQASRAERLHQIGTSTPEKTLFEFCRSISDTFEHSRQLNDDSFSCSSKRRQVDILSRSLKIALEFDGPLHFPETSWKSNIADRVKRDQEVENFMKVNHYSYIRVSYDQFSYRSGFNNECKDKIRDLIMTNAPGVFKIGKFYAENR